MSVSILPTWQNVFLDSRHRMKLHKNISCCAKKVLKDEEKKTVLLPHNNRSFKIL
jgi:hypothetical protein